MNRIYFPYWEWECFKNGVYDSPIKDKDYECIVNSFFNDKEKTNDFMGRVIEEWVISCEHFLSNPNINKIAWLGQSSLCLYEKVPNLTTMKYWSSLPLGVQERSNEIASNNIKTWEEKTRYINLLKIGKARVMKEGYQTKLPLN